jgi:hypothetical protein
VPDNTKPPRYFFEPPPLGARAIMTAIEEIGRAHGLERPRVAYKRTERGEHCIAIIFPGWRRSEDVG